MKNRKNSLKESIKRNGFRNLVICLAAVLLLSPIANPVTARASDGGILSNLGDLLAILGEKDQKPSSGKKEDDSGVGNLMNLLEMLTDQEIPIREASAAKIPDQTYTGKAIRPAPKLTRNGVTLERGTDYSLSYTDNVKVGTAKIKITGKGRYKGTKTVSFKIVKKGSATEKKQSGSGSAGMSAKGGKFTVKSSKNSYVYNGESRKPSVTVTIRGKKVPSSGYSVTYKDNKNVGTATITVTGKGDYKGYTGTATFKITLKAPSFTSASSPESGQIALAWNKDPQADGYQIQYSTDQSFSGRVREIKTDDNTTVRETISSLTPGGKYYVRIRSFKKGSGRNSYGPFGKTRTVTVKK